MSNLPVLVLVLVFVATTLAVDAGGLRRRGAGADRQPAGAVLRRRGGGDRVRRGSRVGRGARAARGVARPVRGRAAPVRRPLRPRRRRAERRRRLRRASQRPTLENTHTHRFNGPFSGTTRVSRYQKSKTNLDFTEARDSEWQSQQLGHTVCKSAPRSRQITTPALHRSVFLQAGCPSCRPTNSVKALKASPTLENLIKNKRLNRDNVRSLNLKRSDRASDCSVSKTPREVHRRLASTFLKAR